MNFERVIFSGFWGLANSQFQCCFRKSMTPCSLKIKVTPGFYFPIVIPDNVTASIKYITLSFLKCCATTYKEDKIRWGSFQESTFDCQLLHIDLLSGLGNWDTVRISIWLQDISTLEFSTTGFNPGLFNPKVLKIACLVEESMA